MHVLIHAAVIVHERLLVSAAHQERIVHARVAEIMHRRGQDDSKAFKLAEATAGSAASCS
jgi:hypothetical protein